MPSISAVGHPKATDYISLACFDGNSFDVERLLARGWNKTNTDDGLLVFKYHNEKWEAVFEIRDCLHELDSCKTLFLVDPVLASDIRTSFRIYA